MNPDQLRILLLEDDYIQAALIAEMIQISQPEAKVVVAHSVVEAQLLIERYHPSLFIIDIHLPDGNGTEFVCDVQATQNDPKSILITADSVPEYPEEARPLGMLTCLRKPIHQAALTDAINQQLNRDYGKVELQFRETLSKLTPMDVIQLKCLSHSTVCLRFSLASKAKGFIHIKDGELIHAETDSCQGILALAEIVDWKHGRLVETDEALAGARTLFGDWQDLISNAARTANGAKVAMTA